jgi:hypothetical protein
LLRGQRHRPVVAQSTGAVTSTSTRTAASSMPADRTPQAAGVRTSTIAPTARALDRQRIYPSEVAATVRPPNASVPEYRGTRDVARSGACREGREQTVRRV